jgi:membrane-bound inhibitor of C-type lysozyme
MLQKTIIVATLVAAGSIAQPSFAADPKARYSCEDGSHFSVRFHRGVAFVTLSDGMKLKLPQRVAGSGIWYSSGLYDLRGKGREAMWTVGRKAPVNCTSAG